MIFKCDQCNSEEFEYLNGQYVCRKCGLVSLDVVYDYDYNYDVDEKTHEKELLNLHQEFYNDITEYKDPNHLYKLSKGSFIPKYNKWHKFYNLSKLHRQAFSTYVDRMREHIKTLGFRIGLDAIEQETLFIYYKKLLKKGSTQGRKFEISVGALSKLVLLEYRKFIDHKFIKSILNEDYNDKLFNDYYKLFKKVLNIKRTSILPLKSYYDFYRKTLGLYEFEYEIISFLIHLENHEVIINQKRSKIVLTIIKLIYKHHGIKCSAIHEFLSRSNYDTIRKNLIPLLKEFYKGFDTK